MPCSDREGPSFSAGIDLAEGMTGPLAEWAGRPTGELTAADGMAVAGALTWIPRLDCASAAAVRGHAYGAGVTVGNHVCGAYNDCHPSSCPPQILRPVRVHARRHAYASQ